MRSPTVVVTGISGSLGRLVARLLCEETPVLGIDHRPFPERLEGVEFHQLDLRKRRVGELFRQGQVGALVHLGIAPERLCGMADGYSLNVLGARNVLEQAARHGVTKVVLLSTALVYGASPENPSFLPEESPLMGAARFPELRDRIQVDMLAQTFFYEHPGIETVILRPVFVVGPGLRNEPSVYLRLDRPWMLAGYDPIIQLIHVEDVALAVRAALRPGIRGVYNLAGPGELPLSAILRELALRPRQIPHPMAPLLLRLLRGARLTRFAAPEIDFLRYACAVDCSHAVQELGWRPARSLRETIRSVRDGK